MESKIGIFFKKNYIFITLFIIIICGIIFRFKGLTFQSYWRDELYSASFSNPENSLDTVFKLTLNDVHPPLYQFFLWILYQIFGYTEFIGRTFSAVTGSIGILAIYFLGKELFNKYVGLYASLLVSTNYFLVFYSQENRSYSLLFLLTVISYIYFTKILRNPTKTNILIYWISTTSLLYTHYFSFFLVSTQVFIFIYYIFYFPERRKSLFFIAVATSIIFVLSLLPLIDYIFIHSDKDKFWIGKPRFYFVFTYISNYFGSFKIVALLSTMGFLTLFYLFRKQIVEKDRIAIIILLIWIIIGYLLPFLRSVLSVPLLTPRNTIVILPAIILITSFGIWKLNGWKKTIFVSIYLFFTIHDLYSYNSEIVKDNYRKVLTTIDSYHTVPIYSAIPHSASKTNFYQTYALILKINRIIFTKEKLKFDFINNNLPECFWVVDAHKQNIYDLEIQNDNSFFMAHDIQGKEFRKARGVLFSHNVSPAYCIRKVGIN